MKIRCTWNVKTFKMLLIEIRICFCQKLPKFKSKQSVALSTFAFALTRNTGNISTSHEQKLFRTVTVFQTLRNWRRTGVDYFVGLLFPPPMLAKHQTIGLAFSSQSGVCGLKSPLSVPDMLMTTIDLTTSMITIMYQNTPGINVEEDE